MTDRLYYRDSYLTAFDARLLEVRPAGGRYHLYLDKTAFYPTSGGQPFDTGFIGGAAVVDVIDEDERIAHVVAEPPAPGPVACRIDWDRRFDHMQQHTGQHLLSAVFCDLLGYQTVSFHLGTEVSTIDLAAPEVTAAQLQAVEDRTNALVFEDRSVTVAFYSPQEAAALGLRKPSEREGSVRVVEIAACDRSACGGTHVRSTGQIGPVLLRRLDRVRQNVRVEFVCGGRAARRARADYHALQRVAQVFSAPLDQTPALVAAQAEALQAAEKARQKLEAELSVWKGRELYQNTPADARGRRVHRAAAGESPLEPWRLLAQSFVAAGPGAVFLAAAERPAAVLLALSADLSLHAGRIVKSVVEPLGGRGGGSPQMAQGSLPDPGLLAAAADQILRRLD